jgi:hypothetical protein
MPTLPMTGTPVFLRLKTNNQYLGVRTNVPAPTIGEVQMQATADDSCVFLLRFSFDRGPAKGPTEDGVFHLVHRATLGGLSWVDEGDSFEVYNYYYTNSDNDMTGANSFNFRKDILGQGFYAVNNHDSNLVMTHDEKSGIVTPSPWNNNQHQFWRILRMNGDPFEVGNQ